MGNVHKNIQLTMEFLKGPFLILHFSYYAIRSDQLGFLFCRPAHLVFFFQIEIRIPQKNTIKYLFEAKIWFILSLRNNRRNIVFMFNKGG